MPIDVKSNRFATNGISITAVVKRSAAIIEPNSRKLCVFKVKIEFFCERILYEWNISAMLIVRNAMVIPWLDCAVNENTPYSINETINYAARVRTDTSKP